MAEEKKKVTTKVKEIKEVFEKYKPKIAVGVTVGATFIAGTFTGYEYAEFCAARGHAALL